MTRRSVMPSRKVVDTSWLYALFDLADPHHARATKHAKKSAIYEVPSEILAETLALRYSRAANARSQAASALFDQIMEAGFHIMSLDDPTPALELYRRKRSLSYPESVAIVHTQDAALLSLDARQFRIWRAQRVD